MKYEIVKKNVGENHVEVKVNFEYVLEQGENLVLPGAVYEDGYVRWYGLFEFGSLQWMSVLTLLDLVQQLLELYELEFGDFDIQIFNALSALFKLSITYPEEHITNISNSATTAIKQVTVSL